MRVKEIFVWLLVFLGTGVAVNAQQPEELFNMANEAYQAEAYDTAIQHYEQILELGYESPAVYYNLGNSYYRKNSISKAILNYERAAQLDPSDEDIQQNLEIARQQTIDQFETLPDPLLRSAYLGLMQLFTPDTWAWLGLIMMMAFCTGLGMYFFSGRRVLGFNIAWIGLLIGVISLGLGFAHKTYRNNNRPAIVTSPSSYVKTAPSEASEDSFILHEGTKALVRDDVGEWKKIRLPDGKIGWIKAEDIEEV